MTEQHDTTPDRQSEPDDEARGWFTPLVDPGQSPALSALRRGHHLLRVIHGQRLLTPHLIGTGCIDGRTSVHLPPTDEPLRDFAEWLAQLGPEPAVMVCRLATGALLLDASGLLQGKDWHPITVAANVPLPIRSETELPGVGSEPQPTTLDEVHRLVRTAVETDPEGRWAPVPRLPGRDLATQPPAEQAELAEVATS